MKTIIFIILLLLGCSKNDFPWDNITLDEAIHDYDKLIMIDFYATW